MDEHITHDAVEASTRRRFLSALAASGVAIGAVTTSSGAAHAQERGGAGDPNPPVPESGIAASDPIEAFPAPTAGVTYRTFLGSSFLPTVSTTAYSKAFGEIRSAGIFYRALTDLPVGSRLAEISYAIIKSAGFPGDTNAFLYRLVSGSLSQLGATTTTTGFPQSDAEQYINLVVPANTLVTADTDLWLVVNMGNNRLNSVRVGYVPPAVQPSFYPIAPKRVYDSRIIAPLGTLGTGGSRTISVADGYPNDVATIDLPGVVPAGATAVAFNVTITGTSGAGYLSVTPGGSPAASGSSINWAASGVTVANGLVGSLGGDRQLTVFCGGAPGAFTHFLIDVLGYYR